MAWMVQLVGDTSDLSVLAQSLTGTDVNVSHDGQNYVLKADTFQDGDDANTIRQKAKKSLTCSMARHGSRWTLVSQFVLVRRIDIGRMEHGKSLPLSNQQSFIFVQWPPP